MKKFLKKNFGRGSLLALFGPRDAENRFLGLKSTIFELQTSVIPQNARIFPANSCPYNS